MNFLEIMLRLFSVCPPKKKDSHIEVRRTVALTQSEYDKIRPGQHDEKTLYVIRG